MGRQGEHRYPDGAVYNGAWSQEGHRHGYGHLSFPDSSSFWGHFTDGLYGRLGVMQFQDGSRYAGEFRNGKFNGFGVFRRADDMMFEGEFKDGKIWGLGLVTFADGNHGLPRNEGYFELNQIVRREKCPQAIYKARETAKRAEHPVTK